MHKDHIRGVARFVSRYIWIIRNLQGFVQKGYIRGVARFDT